MVLMGGRRVPAERQRVLLELIGSGMTPSRAAGIAGVSLAFAYDLDRKVNGVPRLAAKREAIAARAAERAAGRELREARARADGSLVPLADQNRRLWNRSYIEEGRTLVADSLSRMPLGPYQLQAAIAAVHDEAARAEDTDWPQILALYRLLERISPNPMITLNRAVAVAMVESPQAGLELLRALDDDDRISRHHRLDAVRAHLLEMDGGRAAARSSYLRAARRTTSLPEKRYLEARAARLQNQ